MKEELLEYVYERSQESCMSDLKIPSVLRRYIPWIISIDNNRYSIEEWQLFCGYITSGKIKLTDIDVIKNMLLNWAGI